jgi:dynamin 1-like protein
VQIILKIYSDRVVDLILVDLPGMTKISTGSQPHDIEHQINDLVLQYIAPKSAIIMAVCPANADLANADSLKIAKQVDPYCERTLGVLTKVDIMDEGTDIHDILRGAVYPLKLGYIPVVCRSQKDIMEGKTITEGLKKE